MGRLGKDKNPLTRSILATAAIAACANPAAGPNPSRDGRYAGLAATQSGTCGLAATAGQAASSLLIRSSEAIFAPDDGVLVLRGHIDAAGHVTATASGPGADHKPFAMAFEGEVNGNHVSGHYATPRCRAEIQLDRVS